MKAYASLTARTQVERIRKVLPGVVESEWGMPNPELRLVSHDYNTTFRVDSKRGRYALRINTASSRSEAKMLTEIAFVQHLRTATTFHLRTATTFKVAEPIPKVDGSFIATVEVPNFGGPAFGVMYEWLPDPTVGTNATAAVMSSLGRATRELHRFGESFCFDGYPFPTLTDPYYGDPYRLPGQDLDLALFETLAERTMEIFAKLQSHPKIPIHADLHLYNMKFGRQGLAIFDFDDAMVSWPILDAAITMWYFRYRTQSPELEAHYWASFGLTPADFGLSGAEFETLVTSRTLLLVNDSVGTRNATAREKSMPFVRKCEAFVRHYMHSGQFEPWASS